MYFCLPSAYVLNMKANTTHGGGSPYMIRNVEMRRYHKNKIFFKLSTIIFKHHIKCIIEGFFTIFRYVNTVIILSYLHQFNTVMVTISISIRMPYDEDGHNTLFYSRSLFTSQKQDQE